MMRLIAGACAALLAGAAAAAPPDALAPYLDGQTVAVLEIDVARLDTDAYFKRAARIEGFKPVDLDAVREPVEAVIGGFKKLGGKKLYAVVSLADFGQHPPFFVVPVERGVDGKDLAARLTKLGNSDDLVFEARGDAVVGGNESKLARLKGARGESRPDLLKALEGGGDGVARVGLALPSLLRKALEEAMPSLPKAAGGGPMTLLTRDAKWASLVLDAPPKMGFRLVVQGEDARAARGLKEVAGRILKELAELKEVAELLPGAEKVLAKLEPKVEGDRLVLAVGEDELTHLMLPLAARLREDAARKAATENLKQLGIAMHNYHDSSGRLPPAVFADKKGKPLLSWRVHLLPYVDEDKLYKEFKLDEPWDSEHNKKLIKRIPKVFVSPASPRLAEEGKTPYLVPTGPEVAFPPGARTRITDFSDGTSNTILIVEADDDHAVVWTKPGDLAVDMKEPGKGLRVVLKQGYLACFADGSVHVVKTKVGKDMLWALFTRAGGEVISLD